MTFFINSHGGTGAKANVQKREVFAHEALVPSDGDIAVDEAADFGFLLPPTGDGCTTLPDTAVGDLDQLGNLMVPEEGTDTPDGDLPPVMTYWGQFLDHELTARTDRETALSSIENPEPTASATDLEQLLKNGRSPRFDLDSVYGGSPVGPFASPDIRRHVATLKSGLRHPVHKSKMRVGTAVELGVLPDGLDRHRDLPRFHQVEQKVRDAMRAIARSQLNDEKFAEFEASLPKRAVIGDMRNDENIIVAQFHLSVLRFHNRVVDFLNVNDTGWIADFDAAKSLTTLHYQWLAVDGYLKSICDPEVVQSVLDNRARHFFEFREAYAARNPRQTLGNALSFEFSAAAFRFGHSMVRRSYDYNNTFGRPDRDAPFDQIFAFTGGGGLGESVGLNNNAIPQNWIIDWARFVTAQNDFADGKPERVTRAMDTSLAPPLGDMVNEGKDFEDTPDVKALFRHLARRNLRRGLSLRLPTGQALHAHLKAQGAITTDPIMDVAALISGNDELTTFLRANESDLNTNTPLWFYCLAEAEGTPGDCLGPLGSWIVASTFIGVLLDDPDSALSRDFTPDVSPVRMPDGSPIDTIEKWMKFALVLE